MTFTRRTKTLSIGMFFALSSSLSLGSCAAGPDLTSETADAAPAPTRRRPPPPPERCTEHVVVEAPVCG